MKNIGLLSDTHGWIYPGIFDFFKDCDEIWHAGDIGDLLTLEKLEAFKPIRAVYGNIDGRDISADIRAAMSVRHSSSLSAGNPAFSSPDIHIF